MNVLIVHAHHEPRSFSSAMKDRAVEVLRRQGHRVELSDLHALRFDPVSGRHNFIAAKNAAYLKQQEEEAHASVTGGFAADLDTEMEKLERADLLIFSFPLWWFAMPAILKGWVDRVFAMGRIYGGEKLYAGGVGKGKRALILMTAGGPASMYDGFGINPPLETILRPIEHGIFAFNGYAALPAFIVHGPARMTDEQRRDELGRLEQHLARLDELPLAVVPLTSDFVDLVGSDRLPRYMVEVRAGTKDPQWLAMPRERIHTLRRQGKLLAFTMSGEEEPQRRAWMLIRERSRTAVELLLRALPLDEGAQVSILDASRSEHAVF